LCGKKAKRREEYKRTGSAMRAGIIESCKSRAGSVVKKKEKRGVGR
jgi:hypothetical protein